ncbi:MAG TPA: hypothetical protein DCW50_01930 [Gammaproteobacteria bacterium]|nr:hypothetical protein [Gammaproteobacteria bacterium]
MTKASGVARGLGVEHGNGMSAQDLCGQGRQGTKDEPNQQEPSHGGLIISLGIAVLSWDLIRWG